ncbi:AP-4 complex subunit epsilon [Triticum urartu]|uniref:AP-4 complex subunit epsilon n=1 Tax=Triticum urartu TaxID=4572 RepID=M7ZWW2_TRIUA|nr:AP-4 complex subunit epsilon [Triticum urartu]
MGSQGGWGQSKEFLDLVKSIGEARSKAEEDRIISRELDHLKRRLADPDVPRRKMKELLLRLVYAEMLGHDASFGHIHAVKMTHDESLPLKRTGYLAVALFIDERHDLVILVVNTIQKDLRSDNYLVVCAALTAASRLIGEEAIPAVLPQVVDLLAHPKEAVRKKAVMALHRFYQRSPSSVSHLVSNFRKVPPNILPHVQIRISFPNYNRSRIICPSHAVAYYPRGAWGTVILSCSKEHALLLIVLKFHVLYMFNLYFELQQLAIAIASIELELDRLCDNDPGVMGATLCPLYDLILEDPNAYKDLVVSFVNILKQVAERRLPTSYDYHQMPAPFIQIKLLKILAVLGSGDKSASGHMYTVLGDIFRKGDTASNIGNAILYECICCVSCIFPNSKMLDAAAETTSKFLKSDSHNLKYMGIDALGRLIKINPDIAEQHQLAVIDCLEDPDDTLKRKTFELLYKMTKSTNVEVIVDRMIEYMISITDHHYKAEIASRCVELAEQFAPSNQWFIQTMNKVFEHAGDLVNIRVAHNLMRLIAEGFGEEDEGADSQLRSSAVNSYLRILGEPKLPSSFLQIICWVLGEYGTADGKHPASYIIGKLCDVAEAHPTDDTVRGYAVSAILKIFAFEIAVGRKSDMLPEFQSLVDELSSSHSTDLQQRAYEVQALLGLDKQAVESVMPIDASCEDIEVDKNLTFLNSYVQQALENGATPYIPESERSGVVSVGNYRAQDQHETSAHALRFEAYELPKPSLPTATSQSSVSLPTTDLVPVPEPSHYREDHHQARSQQSGNAVSGEFGAKLRLDGVQKKWGRESYASSSTPSSSTSSQQAANGGSNSDGGGLVTSQARESSYGSKSQQQGTEVSAEKQRLAASLFGSSAAKPNRKGHAGRKAAKESSSTEKVTPQPAKEQVTPAAPPPDLLDLGEEPVSSSAPSADPFSQLDGLLGPASASPALSGTSAPSASNTPDLMSIFSDDVQTGATSASTEPAQKGATAKKGHSLQDALQKDATARQVGVTPTGNNPNLFKDLLG